MFKRWGTVGALVAVIASLSSCSSGGGANGVTQTTITRNVDACAAINNQVLGRYKSLSVKDQNIAGQDMLDRALSATDPSIVRDARLLQASARKGDLKAMDADLGELASDCDRLGIGPEQVKNSKG